MSNTLERRKHWQQAENALRIFNGEFIALLEKIVEQLAYEAVAEMQKVSDSKDAVIERLHQTTAAQQEAMSALRAEMDKQHITYHKENKEIIKFLDQKKAELCAIRDEINIVVGEL